MDQFRLIRLCVNLIHLKAKFVYRAYLSVSILSLAAPHKVDTSIILHYIAKSTSKCSCWTSHGEESMIPLIDLIFVCVCVCVCVRVRVCVRVCVSVMIMRRSKIQAA